MRDQQTDIRENNNIRDKVNNRSCEKKTIKRKSPWCPTTSPSYRILLGLPPRWPTFVKTVHKNISPHLADLKEKQVNELWSLNDSGQAAGRSKPTRIVPLLIPTIKHYPPFHFRAQFWKTLRLLFRRPVPVSRPVRTDLLVDLTKWSSFFQVFPKVMTAFS